MIDDTRIRTSHVADAAEKLGVGYGGGIGLTWLGAPEGGVRGRAFTMQQRAVAPGQTGQSLRHGEVSAKEAGQGDLIVIAVEGDTMGATWGEAHALRVAGRGVAGVLTDGLVRDSGPLRQVGPPVLCAGGSPFRSAGRLETLSLREEVQIRGVRIAQGDLVVIDADGFVVIGGDDADAVLAEALQVIAREDARNAAITG